MEGFMLVPPERASIIGRALWKPRYIVLGSATRIPTPPENVLPRSHSSGRLANARKGLKASSSKPSLAEVSPDSPRTGLYVSIYKAKGDWEFISQHAVSSFETCDVQTVQHRKQNPSLPTLVINLKPDLEMEKARKRRSSRTGGLTSSKDPWANTLLFRTVPEERFNIYDWQLAIKPLLQLSSPTEDILSPVSPAFSSFTNPFSPRDARPDTSSGPSQGQSQGQGQGQRPDFPRGISNQSTTSYAHSPRMERPSAIISPSPSLRSRRSDLSSQASSQPMGFTSHHQHYTTALPSDLPSPASTACYETQFIDGWTPAHGRSSTLSSHTRGSNSIASAVAPIGAIASTPPGPRETILDRAFKNRVIPGSDRAQDKDDDKISSIARFEALMKEVDQRNEQRNANARLDNSNNVQGWELDEDSEESDNEEYAEQEEDDDAEGLEFDDGDISIPTPAQRALDYISGRCTPYPSSRRPPTPTTPPIPFLNQQAMSAFHGHSDITGGLRPRTGTTSRPSSLAFPSRSISTATVPTFKDDKQPQTERENRRSSTSAKRLSFTEFARRLSSTSSLLLVQTNASSASDSQHSKRGSSEISYSGEEDLSTRAGGLRSSVTLRGRASSGTGVGYDARDKRCGWRGSVGVFGSEGGIL